MNITIDGSQIIQSLIVLTIGGIITFFMRYIGKNMQKKDDDLKNKLQENLTKIIEVKTELNTKITEQYTSLNKKFDDNFSKSSDKLEEISNKINKINDKVAKYEENIRELYDDIKEVKLKIQQHDDMHTDTNKEIANVKLLIEKVRNIKPEKETIYAD